MNETPEEMLNYLERMAESYENLPQKALYEPITHKDFASFVSLMSGVLRSILNSRQ